MTSTLATIVDAGQQFYLDTEETLASCLAGVDLQQRDYQRRIIDKAIRMFQGRYEDRVGITQPAAGSVMVESPTGSGKTIMGLAIARYMQREHGYSIGWVAMRRNLLSQAMMENRCRGFDVEMEFISMFEQSPPKVDMLVVDEAQHDAAMNMANLHCIIRPEVVLGLTATPFRSDRVKLCFDQVISDAGIHQLIQDGYLSPYHHYTIDQYTPASVANTYLQDPQRWGKSLMFFHRQEQCRECCQRLQAEGVHVEVVTANTDRDQQLRDFTRCREGVLINMNILTEGFDCPTLKTVFCRPSDRSSAIQMGGRVFRKHPVEPIKQIVQCRDTPHPLTKTALADQQFSWVDGGWQALSLDKEVTAISNLMRRKTILPRLVAALNAM